MIICTHNGAARLPETLKHLAAQKVSELIPWEVIIVDNASTDATAETAMHEWKQCKSPVKFSIVKELRPGLIYARLKGIASARYEYLLYCDDDNWLFPDYVSVAFDLMNGDPAIGVLGGCGIFKAEQPIKNEIAGHETLYVNGVQHWAEHQHWVYGAGAVYRRSILNSFTTLQWPKIAVGRTESKLTSGEDVEICFMYHLAGYKVVANEGLKFYHFVPVKRQNLYYIRQVNYWSAYANVLLNNYKMLNQHTPASLRMMLKGWTKDVLIRLIKFSTILLFQGLKTGKKSSFQQRLNYISMRGTLNALITHRAQLVTHFERLQQFINSPEFQQLRFDKSDNPSVL